MNGYTTKTKVLVSAIAALFTAAPAAFAFTSGSTGADGAFSPTVNTIVDLPPSGIFNYTSVNIPTGVTVTFKKNTTNTPVIILASGNVTIAGTLSVNAVSGSTNVGAADDGNLGDDGIPGVGGPGGYDGGPGGKGPAGDAGAGLGPGGGAPGGPSVRPGCNVASVYYGGGGGGFGGNGSNSQSWCGVEASVGGPNYGSSVLLPLVGGSGGGGGSGGQVFTGSGGGAGGGAILIASSGTVSITGAVVANGSGSGNTSGVGAGGTGGGGSGGAIRIVATTLSGNGSLSAVGGGVGSNSGSSGGNAIYRGGAGAVGRIRLEAETITRTAASNPAHSFGAPGPVFIAGLPSLAITSVAGVNAPAAPTGNADITLPANLANPVAVVFQTTGVPVGNTVKLTVKPANGAPVTVISPALTGTTDSATASVNVSLPGGANVLEATTTYTIVASVGDALGAQYAKGERVEKIELAAVMGGNSVATLITVSGKRYPMTAPLTAMGS